MARRKNDAYYSAKWMTHFLLERTPYPFDWRNQTVLEACVGEGAISNALKKKGFDVTTCDINPVCEPDICADYLLADFSFPGQDWIITNPPFSLAYPMLLKAMTEVSVGVAFLLRLSFVEPTEERGDWLECHPPAGRITLPRYSFTGDGRSDSVTAEWMVWFKDKTVPQWNSIVSKNSLREWIKQNG